MSKTGKYICLISILLLIVFLFFSSYSPKVGNKINGYPSVTGCKIISVLERKGSLEKGKFYSSEVFCENGDQVKIVGSIDDKDYLLLAVHLPDGKEVIVEKAFVDGWGGGFIVDVRTDWNLIRYKVSNVTIPALISGKDHGIEFAFNWKTGEFVDPDFVYPSY